MPKLTKSNLDQITLLKTRERINKILYAAGFEMVNSKEIIEESLDFVVKLIRILLGEIIIMKINLIKKNPQQEGKLIMDYFSYVWDEEFYVYSDRFNEEMYFKQKYSRKRMIKMKINKVYL